MHHQYLTIIFRHASKKIQQAAGQGLKQTLFSGEVLLHLHRYSLNIFGEGFLFYDELNKISAAKVCCEKIYITEQAS